MSKIDFSGSRRLYFEGSGELQWNVENDILAVPQDSAGNDSSDANSLPASQSDGDAAAPADTSTGDGGVSFFLADAEPMGSDDDSTASASSAATAPADSGAVEVQQNNDVDLNYLVTDSASSAPATYSASASGVFAGSSVGDAPVPVGAHPNDVADVADGDPAAQVVQSVSSPDGADGAALPTFSNLGIANYLRVGYWADTSRVAHKFDMSTNPLWGANNGVIYWNPYGWSGDANGLTADGLTNARAAIRLFENVLNINFVETSSTGTHVDIFFGDNNSGAYANYTTYPLSGGAFTDYAWVNVHTSWLATPYIGSYGLQTYIHEIGHALGLGHAGDYNGNANYVTDTTDVLFGNNSNHYLNDSWQKTIMSYFDQAENTTVNASYARLLTPMIADWVALQDMYGDSTSAYAGNTTYGFNTNITAGTSSVWNALSTYADTNAFNIIDTSGIDTIDMSGFSANQYITLNSGGISNVGGLTGNMTISEGTTIENAITGAGADTLDGNSAANSLYGNAGNDVLYGDGGYDRLYGGDGNDDLRVEADGGAAYGGNGNDLLRSYGSYDQEDLYGGADNDTFYIYGGLNANDDYYGSTGTDTARFYGTDALAINLSTNDLNLRYGGFGSALDLSSVENVYGGSGNDSVIGSSANNYLYGNDGSDTLYGNSGVDRLYGGDSYDRLYGDADADYLYGGAGGGRLDGGAGSDRLYSYGGIDQEDLYGQDDDDYIYIYSGLDINDDYYGGNGFDRVYFYGFTDALSVNLATNDLNLRYGGFAIDLDFNNIEQVQTGSGNDSIVGDSGNNFLYGGSGNDVIYGAEGTDNVYGSNGTDYLYSGGAGNYYGGGDNDYVYAGLTGFLESETLDGGTGVDRLYTHEHTGNYVIDLGTGVTNFANESFINFEDAYTGDGNDSVTGTSAANRLWGVNGNDTLRGLGGANSLYGGAGDDVLDAGTGATSDYASGSSGNDTITSSGGGTYYGGSDDDYMFAGLGTNESLYGGTGIDTIDTTLYTGPYVIDLGGTTTNFVGEVFDGFENAVTGNGNDSLTGNADANLLNGGGGNDTLEGLGGVDTLIGGTGNDLFIDNLSLVGGDDDYDGGAGIDTFTSLVNWASTIEIDLGAGELRYNSIARDTLTSIENVNTMGSASVFGNASDNTIVVTGTGANFLSSGNGNDSIDAGGGNDTLTGGSGNDTLIAGDGNDQLNGESGNDLLDGGNGTDRAYFLGAAAATVNLSAAGAQNTGHGIDTLISIEDVTSGTGDDVLTGTTGDNSMYAGSGNDQLTGLAGNDYMHGGAGSDRAFFLGAAATTVNLWDATAQNTGHGLDTLISIEHVTSGSGNDNLTGSSAGNSMRAGAGNDTLVGGAGNDALFGEDGNDDLNGGSGNDYMNGGAGGDRVHFLGSAAASVQLWNTAAQNTGHGTDTLVNIEHVTSGSGNDNLIGSSAGNSMRAGAGNDALTSGAGNDALFGEDGNDLLNGGSGNDYMNGGAGADRAYFLGAAAATVSLWNTAAQNTGHGIDTLISIEHASSGSGNDLLIGSSANNSLISGAGNDTMSGGLGNDAFWGGAGNDRATGGAGNDSFNFNTALGAGNVDHITDFTVVDDTIRVDNAYFTGLAGGVLAASAFQSNLTGLAQDATDRIIYQSNTGNLYFDVDGVGGAAGVQFAMVDAGLGMTNNDFFVF